MKKIYTSIILVLATITLLFSQVPEAFNYQAVVRNSSGEIITNTNVAFRISILQGSETGTPVYVETHSVNTNNFGLVNLQIGKGTVTQGVFMPGDWGAASHFIKVEFDKDGGTGYVHLGTSPLLSVPYAFHAQTVAEDAVDDADADATNEIQSLQLSGTKLTLSKNGGTVTLPSSGGGGDNWGTQTVTSDATLEGRGTEADPLKVANNNIEPVWANIANKPAGFADDEDDVNDHDADPDNEIQTLSISGNDLSISAGNTVTLPESASVWSTQGTSAYFNGGKVGIGTTSPSTVLHVRGGGFLVEGENANATIPATGNGTRMMWYPNKSAFRAGEAVSNVWDDSKIGSHSVAIGIGTEASGNYSSAFGYYTRAKAESSIAMGLGAEASGGLASIALGEDTRASGANAFAVGISTNATGERSTAMGISTLASGKYSTALGDETTASGVNSLAAGQQTKAESYLSTVFGRYNKGGGSATIWDGYDPLFEIGNGTSSNRRNAFTVFKNGNVGIGESYPLYDLDVSGMLCVRDGAGLIFAPQSDKVRLVFFTNSSDINLAEFKNSGINFQTNVHVMDGDVGIGTENPERILHIKDNNPRILIEATSSNPEINFKNEGDIVSSIWSIYKNGDTGDLHFYQNGNKLTLQKNTGNIGIGTTNPQGKLDVNGSIYQRGGQLHADYVFEDNYQLESIEEHAEFMWENKHLPAIPKASTDDNGLEIIEVGSHRRGIVEELEKAHIYISQLEKTLQQQAAVINNQESRLKQLESVVKAIASK